MPIRTARHDDDALEDSNAINVRPVIDMMLVLLIICMVAVPLATVDSATTRRRSWCRWHFSLVDA